MSNSGATPLHDAAGNESGDINPMSNSGVTPLHDAARNECGDINPMSNSGVTPLHDAARNECGSYFELAKRLWKNKVGNSVEFPKNPKIQKEWGLKMCQSTFDRLMEAASDSPHERARLMAVSSKNASDWLNCIPIPSLGLKLNPSQLKIASALRLGAPVCRPFKCFHCSGKVSSLGRHDLQGSTKRLTFCFGFDFFFHHKIKTLSKP
jgi:hypothetical protein